MEGKALNKLVLFVHSLEDKADELRRLQDQCEACNDPVIMRAAADAADHLLVLSDLLGMRGTNAIACGAFS